MVNIVSGSLHSYTAFPVTHTLKLYAVYLYYNVSVCINWGSRDAQSIVGVEKGPLGYQNHF